MATQTGYKTSELGEIPQDWEVVELGDVAEIKSGGTPSTHQSEFWNGYILWCTPTDITSLSGKYLSDTNRKISELGLINSAAELLPIGSVLMTSRATIGECAIANQPMTTNQGFKNFICNKRINNEFLYYLLGSQKDKFIELCNGSTFLEINTTQVRKFKIAIPKSTTEQTAIAVLAPTPLSLIRVSNIFFSLSSKNPYSKSASSRKICTHASSVSLPCVSFAEVFNDNERA